MNKYRMAKIDLDGNVYLIIDRYLTPADTHRAYLLYRDAWYGWGVRKWHKLYDGIEFSIPDDLDLVDNLLHHIRPEGLPL